jgi:hypothetical protein
MPGRKLQYALLGALFVVAVACQVRFSADAVRDLANELSRTPFGLVNAGSRAGDVDCVADFAAETPAVGPAREDIRVEESFRQQSSEGEADANVVRAECPPARRDFPGQHVGV